MSAKKRGRYWYGEDAADLRIEIARFAELNGYAATEFAEAICACGQRTFSLSMDQDAGVAVRTCIACSHQHVMLDGQEYLAEADLIEYGCPCNGNGLNLSVGIALYEDSQDVRWVYVGGFCPKCGLIGVYGDWKNEFEDFRTLLAAV